ncbi:MAG: sensor histidine kinase [Mycobacteriales bacterium]
MTDQPIDRTSHQRILEDRLWNRRYVAWASIYLVFLVFPATDLATGDRPVWELCTAAATLVLFVVLYLLLLLGAGFHTLRPRRYARRIDVGVAILIVMAIVTPLAFGGSFAGLMIYASCAFAAVNAPRVSAVAVGVLAAMSLMVLLVVHAGVGTIFVLTLLTVLGPLSTIGLSRMRELICELAATREENARLAVSEERLRFARDLHDLLGHSLSLVVLKAELAGRLVQRNAARATSEIADIESVARQALVEVREAVSGYRRSLEEELDGARRALEAAAIKVELPSPGPPLPAPVESLLAWAIREATTNILRHSHASHVVINLRSRGDSVELVVDDDGVGLSTVDGGPASTSTVDDPAAGHGLCGLAERMAAAGGDATGGPRPAGGFRVSVTVPFDAPSYAAAPRPPVRAAETNPDARPLAPR